jgi:predicted Zn-dependent peptidase
MPFHQAQTTRLKNGTRVIQVPSHDTQAVTVLVLFEVGSRYETLKLSGASHYVEHMMFKGTKRRPNTSMISRDLDSVGADYNAFTGKDYTGYYIRLAATHTELAVDMLHDMLFHSLYEKVECERERKVIIEEINMYEDNPIMAAEELLEELVYEGTPLGRNIAGTHATMNGISRKMLTDYRDEYYAPSRTVIAVAGKLNADVMKLLEKTFGTVRGPKKKARGYLKGRLRSGGPKLALKFKETEQIQFTLGFPGYAYGHKKLPALSVLSTVLGGGMSSRLFTEVRERRGLAYSVRAGTSPYQDCGNFAIQAGLTKSKIEEGISTILKEVGDVVKSGVTVEELHRAKEYIKGKTVLGLEESSALAEFFAKQELLRRQMDTPEEKIARIMAVTREDIKAVAREVFQTAKLSAAIIGPYKDRKPFQKLLKVPHA